MNQNNKFNKNNTILCGGILLKSSVFDEMYNMLLMNQSVFTRTLKYILKSQVFSKTIALSSWYKTTNLTFFSPKLYFLDYLKAKMANFILES